MNKKAFTLIEVLVSVVILSSVAVLLFEISTNSKNNFSYLTQKGDFTTLASLPLTHSSQELHNKEKDLFEFVKDKYDIKDDELRKYLKSQKVHYSHEEFSTFAPFSDHADSEQDDQNQNPLNFTLVFDKVIISNKKQSTFIYKIYLR